MLIFTQGQQDRKPRKEEEAHIQRNAQGMFHELYLYNSHTDKQTEKEGSYGPSQAWRGSFLRRGRLSGLMKKSFPLFVHDFDRWVAFSRAHDALPTTVMCDALRVIIGPASGYPQNHAWLLL